MTDKERIAEIDAQVTALNKERRELRAKIMAEHRKAKECDICCEKCDNVVTKSDGRFECIAFPVYGMGRQTKDIAFTRKVNGKRDRTLCKAFVKRIGRPFFSLSNEVERIIQQKKEQGL